MKVSGPFRELENDQDYRLITLDNGITALLISTEKKDTPVRRATSNLNVDDRKAVVKLLRELSGAAVASTARDATRQQRRSTLLTEGNAGTLQSLFRKSQHRLSGLPNPARKSDLNDDSGDPIQNVPRTRTSQRLVEDGARNRTSQKLDESKSRVSVRFNQIKEDEEVKSLESVHSPVLRSASRKLDVVSDDADERISLASRRSLPGGNAGRRNHSHRMSSAFGAKLLAATGSALAEDSLPLITDVGAGALCVSVGSLSDPADCQGLAHVIEHMVFMGNEEFPNENDWDTFLASAGGDSNASTESERTTFHFTVPQESFSETLKRFASLFRYPLLKKESLQRELAAIDSEFNDSAGEVGFRLAEVACATARRGPFSQFACGNSKSLKSNPDLHSCVIDFFNAHYLATNMTVVLYSSDSLDDMETMCVQEFSAIPPVRVNPSRQMPRFVPELPPFRGADVVYRKEMEQYLVPGEDGYSLGCIVVCDPGAVYPHTLQLSWQLPSQRSKWASKPLLYVSRMVGSEAKGSILQELRSKGWGSALFASDGTYASGIEGNAVSTVFSISIVLTESGLLNWEHIVSSVFEYLGMLARVGVQKWIFDELQACLLAQFIIQDASSPGPIVEAFSRRLCSIVSELPPERVCNGEDLVFEYEPEAIHEILRLLVPETCRIDLITPVAALNETSLSSSTAGNSLLPGWMLGKVSLRKKVIEPLLKDATVKIEPWYQTAYCVTPVSKKIISKWRNSLRVTKTFAQLPDANIFISNRAHADTALDTDTIHLNTAVITDTGRAGIEVERTADWSLVRFSESETCYIRSTRLTSQDGRTLTNSDKKHLSNGSVQSVPALIELGAKEANYIRIWFQTQTSFEKSSRVTIIFSVRSRPGVFSALQAALLDLLLVCWEDAIAEDRYAAELCGTRIEVKVDDVRGFTIIFSGLASSVHLLAERTLPALFRCAQNGIKNMKNLSLDAQLQSVLTRLANDDSSLKETLDGVLRIEEHHSLTKLSHLEALDQVKQRLDSFAREYFSDCRVSGFVLGKMAIKHIISVGKLVADILAESSANKEPWEPYFKAPETMEVARRNGNFKPHDTLAPESVRLFVAPVPSSSVLMYIQLFSLAPSTKHDDAMFKQRKYAKIMMQLLAQLMKEPLFSTLRTKWQIAYHAHVSAHECGPSSLGLTLEVSSHHTTSLELVELLDEFLILYFETLLEPMSLVDFNRHLRALELRKLEKDRGPDEEARRYFKTLQHGLATGHFDWNADSSEVEYIGQLTKNAVMDYFLKFIHPSSAERRTLTLLVVGEEELDQTEEPGKVGASQSTRRLFQKETSNLSHEALHEEEGNESLDESKTQVSQLDTKWRWWKTGDLLRKMVAGSN